MKQAQTGCETDDDDQRERGEAQGFDSKRSSTQVAQVPTLCGAFRKRATRSGHAGDTHFAYEWADINAIRRRPDFHRDLLMPSEASF